MHRRAVFAQQGWYPRDPRDLAQMLQGWLGQPADGPPWVARAVVSPHAGYRYSGAVAGAMFRRVQVPERVVLLSVNHRGYGRPVAVWPNGSWEIPGADVPVDAALVEALLAHCDVMAPDPTAHEFEHSGELQLPLLHARNPDVRIVPIALSHLSLAACASLGQQMAEVLQEYAPDALIVASTDLNHYEDQQTTLRKDALAIARIEALDPEGLYRTVADENISMCGVVPVTVALFAARALGAQRVHVVEHATSGDVTGDHDAVVGYLSAVVV